MTKLLTRLSFLLLAVFNLSDANAQCLAEGGLISTQDATTICAGDGQSDPINVTLDSNMAANSGWVITDTNGIILGLPPAPPFDLDGAGAGVCLIWHLSYENGLTGLSLGSDVADLMGCFDFSNEITVTRYVGANDGGIISTADPTMICAGDGIDDPINVALDSASGSNMAWIITDTLGNILGLPPGSPFNLEGAGTGVCIIWNLSFEDGLLGATVGNNVSDLRGCYNLSNGIPVTRNGVDGGNLATTSGETEVTICVGDRQSDPIDAVLTGTAAAKNTWVITDTNGLILGAPPAPPFDLDSAGAGVCLIWNVNYLDTLFGVVVGQKVSNIKGCFALSNPIRVTRIIGSNDGGIITTMDPTTICAGDGIDDPINVMLDSASGSNMAWVITDSLGNILGLPPGSPFNLEGAGSGVCIIWNLSFEDGLKGAEVGNNVANLKGCYDLSNGIAVTRNGVDGGNLTGFTGNEFHRAVIANRASGTITVIDSETNEIESTHAMPDNGEPMYVVYDNHNNNVLVGDYNGKVVAFDGLDFSVVGSADAGSGVFHMWLSPDGQQLWVNNELDKSISVIEPSTMSTLTTFSIPTDLLDAGYKPHDVILMPNSAAAFVTMLGPLTEDYVVKYSTTTFEETDRAAVGSDPHVSVTSANDKLYVASQGSSELKVLNRSDLSEVTTLAIPNAHGLGMNPAGTHLYISNISQGGANAIYTMDLTADTIVGTPVNAPFSGPHNIAVTSDNQKLFVTHSGGTNDKVSIYSLSPIPSLNAILTVGNNPFGLATYTYTEKSNEFVICAGDNRSDAIDVGVQGSTGVSSWVITDTNGLILGLPMNPPFDLDGAGAGVCQVWHMSSNGIVNGLIVGNSITDLDGCYDLSNPITVIRYIGLTAGGTISTTDPTAICAGDGIADPIDVALTGASGTNMAWVITDFDGNILALPMVPPFDLEGAGDGICVIWNLSFEDGLVGVAVGNHIDDLQGCYALSNGIIVTRKGVDGGDLSMTNGDVELVICAGDGAADPIDITLMDDVGENSNWVITDTNGVILGLPMAPPFDLDGAGVGVCQIWHLSSSDPVTGLAVGNAVSDLIGCYDFSNEIRVTRYSGVTNGGIITTSDATTICAGDGEADPIDVDVSASVGSNGGWIITDTLGNILGLPMAPPFDLNGAGVGVCQIYYIGYEDGLIGMEIGANVGDFQGCYDLSNSIVVTRYAGATEGGTITTSDPTDICAGDGMPDPIDVAVTGAIGTNEGWVITDTLGNILGLPTAPPFDLDGAGVGVCEIWYIRYEEGLLGKTMGNNVSDLQGCYDLSNQITVTRDTSGSICNSGSRDFSNDLGIQVYPNITADIIKIDARDINENLRVTITDISGKQLFNHEFNVLNSLIPLQVGSYASGTYVMQLATITGTQQLKFLKVE